MLNIALPKGRLGDSAYKLLASIGYSCLGLGEDRRLIYTSEMANISYCLIKPSDLAVYVERGACDIGIVGKDVLLETNPNVYELLDLNIGKCKVAVAAINGFKYYKDKPIKVATKYPNIAKKYFWSKNINIEIIKLNGSIELAPILGMCDVIVDIVETGVTLRENNLSVLDIIDYSSARLIVNKSVYNFKRIEIDSLIKDLRMVL